MISLSRILKTPDEGAYKDRKEALVSDAKGCDYWEALAV